jgi:hypothetical protein
MIETKDLIQSMSPKYSYADHQIIHIRRKSMECPYCKQPMKKGSIHCHNGLGSLTWRADDGDDKRVVETWTQAFFINLMRNIHYYKACDVMIRNFKEEEKR